MPGRSNIHLHLSHMLGKGAEITRLSETIAGGDAARRLLEEIAARFVAAGCRAAKYDRGIRIYDCKNSTTADQSFEIRACEDDACNTAASELEYGRWTKHDRARYLQMLTDKGVIP